MFRVRCLKFGVWRSQHYFLDRFLRIFLNWQRHNIFLSVKVVTRESLCFPSREVGHRVGSGRWVGSKKTARIEYTLKCEGKRGENTNPNPHVGCPKGVQTPKRGAVMCFPSYHKIPQTFLIRMFLDSGSMKTWGLDLPSFVCLQEQGSTRWCPFVPHHCRNVMLDGTASKSLEVAICIFTLSRFELTVRFDGTELTGPCSFCFLIRKKVVCGFDRWPLAGKSWVHGFGPGFPVYASVLNGWISYTKIYQNLFHWQMTRKFGISAPVEEGEI